MTVADSSLIGVPQCNRMAVPSARSSGSLRSPPESAIWHGLLLLNARPIAPRPLLSGESAE